MEHFERDGAHCVADMRVIVRSDAANVESDLVTCRDEFLFLAREGVVELHMGLLNASTELTCPECNHGLCGDSFAVAYGSDMIC